MKNILKNLKCTWIEMWEESMKPVSKEFLTYAPGKTLIMTALFGFIFSSLFISVDAAHAIVVLGSFIGLIYIFFRTWKQVKETIIQAEKERIERICQIIDFFSRRNKNK